MKFESSRAFWQCDTKLPSVHSQITLGSQRTAEGVGASRISKAMYFLGAMNHIFHDFPDFSANSEVYPREFCASIDPTTGPDVIGSRTPEELELPSLFTAEKERPACCERSVAQLGEIPRDGTH